MKEIELSASAPVHNQSSGLNATALAKGKGNKNRNPSTAPKQLKRILDQSLPGLRHFNLKDIGIDQERFINDILVTFENLPIDLYEKRRQQITYLKEKFPGVSARLEKFLPDFFSARASLADLSDVLAALSIREMIELESLGDCSRRAVAKFDVIFRIAKFPEITRVVSGPLVMSKDISAVDVDACRFYPEISERVADHSGLRQLCRVVALMVKGLHKDVQKLRFTVHQSSTVNGRTLAFHQPEQLHQAHVDFVVPSIAIALENAATPVGTIYDSAEKTLYKSQLKVGEGLFYDRSLYKHSLSALQPRGNSSRYCAIGLDVQVLS